MKKLTIMLLVLFSISLIPSYSVAAIEDVDLQAVKKAVKDNPNYSGKQDVKWFKILITEDNKEKVKITLPLALMELFMRSAKNKNLRIHDDDLDIDLRELFTELKKMGPMTMIEIYDSGETIKIWLE